jgi:hypothetical protein
MISTVQTGREKCGDPFYLPPPTISFLYILLPAERDEDLYPAMLFTLKGFPEPLGFPLGPPRPHSWKESSQVLQCECGRADKSPGNVPAEVRGKCSSGLILSYFDRFGHNPAKNKKTVSNYLVVEGVLQEYLLKQPPAPSKLVFVFIHHSSIYRCFQKKNSHHEKKCHPSHKFQC